MPDASCRSRDEHALTLLQPAMIEQPLPRAQRGERHRGALDVVERAWLRGENVGGNGGILGGDTVVIEGSQRVHRVTGPDRLHAGRDRGNDPDSS